MTTAIHRPAAGRVPLYGWLTAECVSLLGTRVSMIAIPWLVLTTTGSTTRTGLVAFAEITPMVLLKAFGGPLVDRAGARRTAITADGLSFLVVGLIPLLHHAGALGFPLLLGLVAVAGALRGPGDAATTALIPALVERAEVPFERATGLSSAIERGATMIGAAIAGGLVATVGAANAVAVDAVSFGVCAVLLLVTTRSLEQRGLDRLDRRETPTSYVDDLREGWRFLRRDAVLMSLCLMVAVTNLLDLAWSAVLLPVWAHESGAGVGAVGLVFSVWGGASMLGSVVAAAYGTRLPRFATYLVAFLVTGLPRLCCSRWASRCGRSSPCAWSAERRRASSTRCSAPCSSSGSRGRWSAG
jgi:MFS family permease